jgi:hypothetical protein
MRVYAVESDGKFREYVPTPFQAEHQEAILEDWLEENPDGILEDGKLLIIGRQVNTNLDTTIDLLALDRAGDVVVLELKRGRTPRETLAQALEYASFAEQLDIGELEGILRSYMSDESLVLAEYHRTYFELAPDDAVAFNKDQRIVIVGQCVTSEIRQAAVFLRNKGVRVTCVEFSFFQSNDGTVYKQSIYTTLMGRGGISMKTTVPENEVKRLWSEAQATGLFRPAGHELRCSIDRPFTEMEMHALLSWCQEVAATIMKYGLKE